MERRLEGLHEAEIREIRWLATFPVARFLGLFSVRTKSDTL